jgi:hypothetical protein
LHFRNSHFDLTWTKGDFKSGKSGGHPK